MSKSSNENDAPALNPGERDYLREGFERLLPTPELEAAVQEIAAMAPTASAPWKGRLGLVATLAVAAAALFALYLPTQNDSAPAGPGEPVEATSDDLVVCPPSKEEVDSARSANPLPKNEVHAGTPPRWHHEGRTTDGGTALIAVHEFLAPVSKMRHRWVVREDDRQFKKPDEYDFGMPPKDGIMLLGAGILNKLGGIAHFDKDGALVVKTAKGEWRALPKSSTAEIEISSPETGGASARIRVGISTAYEGSVMLEEPLARALGLQHFEHPRTALLGGKLRWRATQSYARIRIPSVEFDETMLVQVKELREGSVVPLPSPPDTRMTIRGVVPNRVAHADELRYTRDGGFEVTDQDSSMTLGLRATTAPGKVESTEVRIKRNRPMDVALVYDRGATGQPDAYVFAGRFDARPDHPIGPGFLTKWCEVRLPKAPGARVTIARVWRGSVAIPSREGVTITWADKNGRVRCPRIVGEAPAPLRMRVEPKHGKPFFQRLDLDARSGAVNFDGPTARISIGSAGELGSSGLPVIRPRPAEQEERDLLTWLRKQTKDVPRTDGGNSQLVLLVDASDAAPMRAWLRLLEAAAHADIQVRRFRLQVHPQLAQRRDAGTTVEYRLPQDAGLQAVDPGPAALPLPIILGRAARSLTIHVGSVGGFGIELGGTAQSKETLTKLLRTNITNALSATRSVVIRVRKPADLDRFHVGGVAFLLKALEGLKLESIGFEGPSTRR